MFVRAFDYFLRPLSLIASIFFFFLKPVGYFYVKFGNAIKFVISSAILAKKSSENIASTQDGESVKEKKDTRISTTNSKDESKVVTQLKLELENSTGGTNCDEELLNHSSITVTLAINNDKSIEDKPNIAHNKVSTASTIEDNKKYMKLSEFHTSVKVASAIRSDDEIEKEKPSSVQNKVCTAATAEEGSMELSGKIVDRSILGSPVSTATNDQIKTISNKESISANNLCSKSKIESKVASKPEVAPVAEITSIDSKFKLEEEINRYSNGESVGVLKRSLSSFRSPQRKQYLDSKFKGRNLSIQFNDVIHAFDYIENDNMAALKVRIIFC